MNSKILYELLVRSYKRLEYFLQTWNFMIAKNINVNQQKSKRHEKFNFSFEKIQKM